MLVIFPAGADYCKQGGHLNSCGTHDPSWVRCGKRNGEPIWIDPAITACSGDSGDDRGKTAANTFIYVGVGLAFVAVMWYVFKAPPSQNNPGQVRLAEF